MALQDIIRQRRKLLGMTQEQLADVLSVSIAAVSKWETGQSNPDISLLIPLARHLQIDLNALFEFSQSVSDDKIENICRELADLANERGIADSFVLAEKYLQEYPQDTRLLYVITMELDGLSKLYVSNLEESTQFSKVILKHYHQLCSCSDTVIRNSAQYMLANHYIDNGCFERAQEIIDCIMDFNENQFSMSDRSMLQIKLYDSLGEYEKAATLIQQSLFSALNRVQVLLHLLIKNEISCGEKERAFQIAERAKQIALLSEQDAAQYCASYLTIAQEQQDADMALRAIESILESIQHPINYSDTLLFSKLKTKKSWFAAHILPAILREMETDETFAFLRDTDAYAKFMSHYAMMP